MIELKAKYQREEFLKFIGEDFLSDFNRDVRQVNTSGLTSIQKANYLGESKILDLQVFEFFYDGSSNKRVALTKDAFSVMRSSAIFRALAVFKSSDSDDWRFSLLTATPEATEKGKVAVSYSNPKRLSFFLGPNAKVNTPTKFLISKGKVVDFEDLKSRFSIEVVNKEFYKEISHAFTKLVGGLLKLPDTTDKSQTSLEFAVRLIGRIIFCWFLKEKKNKDGIALVPQELLSLEALSKHEDYYHNILEPIFFEILNKPIKERIDKFTEKPYSTIPYLNGGLFSPEKDDFYKRGIYQSDFYNNLVIPNEWLKEFFAILETYNFTIDENTSYDEELSIDPEMLGRIFENLLAEINPETGESARKSTGSYYTPRIIVDYMVDESLLLYLKQQTQIKEEKLKAVISYELSDDADNPISLEEREKVVNALEKVKILDPACGSGAFPIGALQKIVFILQQVDPDGSLWFKKQLAKASPEFRKDIEKKFSNKEFDFLRKLGVIRECIYGVDIQPIATEISRLRCFLTLIVDERIDDDEENRGIKPLPNLDFKFVTANSLIGLPKLESDVQQQSLLPDNKEDIDELKNIKDSYFTSFGIEREQLKTAFAEQQNILIKQFFRDYNLVGNEKNNFMQKITDWKPFTHQATDWFDPEWMFGIKEGFDIVIANPPYVTSKYGKISNDQKDSYKKLFYSAYDKIDLYVLFLEKGIQLSKINGFATMITPWNYLKNFYSFKIRKYILDNCSIILFYKLPPNVFNKVIVDNIISIYQHVNKNTNTNNLILFDDIFDINNRKNVRQSNFVNADKYVFAIPTEENDDKILLKMTNNSLLLGKIALNYIGIMTGGQKTMIADKPIFSNSKPVLSGKEIGKWFYNDIGKYVNFDKSKIHSNDNEDVYLAKRKILLRKTGKILVACLDENQFYTIQSLYNIVIRDKNFLEEYVLALLNSRLFTYIYNKFYITNPEVFPYIKRRHLDMLPIKKLSHADQSFFVDTVSKILSITNSVDYVTSLEKQTCVKEYEKQIDQMVYKLYDLTLEEIDIVENKK